MSKARELAELSRTVSDSADAVAITIDSSEDVTFSEDIKLGDGKKAIFGAGSDLEILSNGTDGLIRNGNAAGEIRMESDDRIIISDIGFNEVFAVFNDDDDVKLYHNGNQKLATTSTGIALTSTGATDVTLQDTDGGFSASKINVQNGGRDLKVTAPQDIILNVGSSDVVNIINGGNIGINTTNPQYVLDVDDGTGNAYIAINRLTQSQGEVGFKLDGGTSGGDWFIYQKTSGNDLHFYRDADLVTIKTDGNVGIGVTNMGATGLSLDSDMNVSFSEGANSSFANIFRQASSAATVIANGYKHISTANKMASSLSSNWAKAAIAVNYGTIRFYTDSASTDSVGTELDPSERMRLTDAGSLLVGKSSGGNTNTAGFEAQSTGFVGIAADGIRPLQINRKTDDGNIIELRQDGTTVGAIGTINNLLTIGSNDTGLIFNSGSDAIYPWNVSTNAGSDGSIDLGIDTRRYKNLYLSSGIYLGGTGANNHLDDYEEGTWTPVYQGGSSNPSVSYNIQQGRYTKVGRLVVAHCRIRTSAVSSQGSGYLAVGGLPFASLNVTNIFGSGIVSYTGGNTWTDDNAPSRSYVNSNSTQAILVRYDSTDPRDEGSTSVNAGSLATGSSKNDLIITLVYATE